MRLLSMLVITLLAIALPYSIHAASVTASLDKNVATENEIVQLTLRADFSNTGNGPDLTPLQRDFEVLGRSQNSQFSFNLGTSTALNFWVVSLMPKSVGTFEIPPIKVGEHQSQPIKLTVKNSPQLLDRNGNPPVIMKTEVSVIEPYLQQEIILSVKLYTSVALQNASRSTPSHPDLIIERLVDDQLEYQTINGTQYQVITREYLAFPQSSGSLTIPPQSIQAMVNTSTGRRRVKVQSEPINLQILPIPASYSSDVWLPSSAVTVSTKLEKTNDSPRIGDTLIWTINVKAEGALPEQIPTLDFQSTRDYKLYPKPPELTTQKTETGVIGSQTIRIEVVPTEEGILSLPDVEISYWDTNKRSIANIKTPTDGIQIGPLPNGVNTKESTTDKPNKPIISEPLPAQPKSVAPISLVKPAKKASEPDDKEDNTTLEKPDESLSLRHYLIVGLLLLALSALCLWLILWFKKKRTSFEDEPNVPTLQDFAPLSTQDEESAYIVLIQSCQQNNLTTLRPNLLEWARHRWGDNEIQSVDDIKRLTSVKVTQLLMEAELMLYSNNANHEWQGEPLAEALEEYTSGQEKPSQESQLKTLYPDI